MPVEKHPTAPRPATEAEESPRAPRPGRACLVSVVTLTHDRPDALLRCVRSVAAQDGVRTEHVIVGDACPRLDDEGFVAALRDVRADLVIHNQRRAPGFETSYLSSRLGRMRNVGIALSRGAFVAQLDDDNAYRPGHLRTLVRALEDSPDAGVAHSWRRLVTDAGEEFVPAGEDPWWPVVEGRAARSESYRRLVRLGVFVPGSPVVRDVFKVDGELVARLDTNELLVRREIHDKVPFREEFSRARQKMQWTEDFTFAIDLARAGIDVVCTRRATVDYTMGGCSTNGEELRNTV
ncbi:MULTISPECIES: glycosyltransferase family 2 protein [unclassified Streptomyces]|uniref:glycosyltransferase family 2 protein n=1 Tax=unclassified Streptomyces TaxID=2593676 RepID=UPI00136F228F|nr:MULTISPECIES: glycosyltransferase family 2 protein [unclassified Streptomyces]MCW5252468.1 glycosyltransferase [Streptomyces sp. SHP 1-2]MYU21071.1 glycosyltransferase [Streptomyces sp. SID8352]